MFRLLGSAIVAAALLLIPVGISIQVSDHALAQATDKADTAEKGKAKTAKQKKKRELTKGQKSARERQRQCGQEWREAKKAGKIEKGQTWPKYWSACNTRLKGKAPETKHARRRIRHTKYRGRRRDREVRAGGFRRW